MVQVVMYCVMVQLKAQVHKAIPRMRLELHVTQWLHRHFPAQAMQRVA